MHVYLRSLGALLTEGAAYVAAPDGEPPAEPQRWGWVDENAGRESEWSNALAPRWRPRGNLLGWTDGDNLFLEPDVAYRLARQFAESAGAPLGITRHAVHQHLSVLS